ncbi:MAG TPA: hypothetical protein VJO15_03580 [Dehalococcoidia bacterium]|nr:hypothetical protein [Dehalococcoidia bacterium]
MIRSIRPTDLASLLAFQRKGHSNDAKTGKNLGRRERRLFSIGRFLQEWLSLEEDRYTWIDISRGRIRGLISVRSRPSPIAWQVDTLILGGGPDCPDICLGLMDYISAVGGEVGVQKVFLRIERNSRLKDGARQAGFVPYKSELLYWRESLSPTARDMNPANGTVRAKRSADDTALFQLYSQAVPGHVREAEAMTFDEWKAIIKKDLSLPTQQQLVLERDGNLLGWLRVRRGGQANSFDVLSLPQEREALVILVEHCLGLLDQRRPTYCLFSEYREEVRQVLEERDFRLAGEYSSLVKQLAVRVRQPRFVPARI